MNSVIWSIDQVDCLWFFSLVTMFISFQQHSECLAQGYNRGEPAFLPASCLWNSLWACDVTKIAKSHALSSSGLQQRETWACFCSCPLQTSSRLIGRVCAFYTSVFLPNPYYWFPNDKLNCAGFSELGCHVGQSLLAWEQDLPFRWMPGQLTAEAKMKKMWEWLTFTSRSLLWFSSPIFSSVAYIWNGSLVVPWNLASGFGVVNSICH